MAGSAGKRWRVRRNELGVQQGWCCAWVGSQVRACRKRPFPRTEAFNLIEFREQPFRNDSRRRDLSQRLPVSLGPIRQLRCRGALQRSFDLSVDGPDSFPKNLFQAPPPLPRRVLRLAYHRRSHPAFMAASVRNSRLHPLHAVPVGLPRFTSPLDLRPSAWFVRDGLSVRPRPPLADQAGFVPRA